MKDNITTNASNEVENFPIGNVLSDEYIGVIARKVALKYAYSNEHSYDMYVKAIIEGMNIGRNVVSKNIT